MTEPDNNRHNPTIQLSDRQLTAIETLVVSGTQTDAAYAAGVTRQTVNQWANHHYGFIAELNRLRSERLQTCADRLQNAVSEALELVAEHIEQGDIAIATGLLKLVGVDHLRVSGTNYPSQPDAVRQQLIANEYGSMFQKSNTPDFMATQVDRDAKRAFDTGEPPE